MLQKIVLRDANAARWMLFTDPVDVLVATDVSGVLAVLEEAERRVRDEGVYAAGFVTFEAAAAFDEAYVTHARGRLPLICFGLFRGPRVEEHLQPPDGTAAAFGEWRMSVSRDDYVSKIAAIKARIAEGNTYQVNYTVRLLAENFADPRDLFLRVASDAPYAAWIECEDHAIVSASPELFFELDDRKLTCRPMKGTAARGLTQRDDLRARDGLAASAKNRAENVMIADMVRNDLGRIAAAGSVRAAPLFEVEKYPTVWQMTSTVTAVTNAPLTEIFRALFPCASITGAPKVSSMKLIAGLEDSPREIYTGAIGFLAPQRQASFSVAIRTAWIDKGTGRATYGTGGGIVWDSDPDDEYRECLDKARVLSGTGQGQDFALLETLLWTPDEDYFLLDEHLQRLADSAAYFEFAFDREAIARYLEAHSRKLPDGPCRVRLLLHRDGSATSEHVVFAADAVTRRLRVRLAAQPVDADDPFLYHKTTERRIFEQARSRVGDCDDVLLWNRERELTESTIANVVVKLHGRYVTPPVECGLLPGTFRAKLLREGTITERRIGLDELSSIEELFLVNSVRRWMSCSLALDDQFTAGRSITAD